MERRQSDLVVSKGMGRSRNFLRHSDHAHQRQKLAFRRRKNSGSGTEATDGMIESIRMFIYKDIVKAMSVGNAWR